MHNNFPTKFYFINSFRRNKIDNLDYSTGVIYRNYKKKLDISEIIKIRDYCSRRKIKFFLSNNFRVALKLKLNGAYLPSFYKDFKHLSYKMNSSFEILGSAHNIKEIRFKETQKVNFIFLSSIFKKNNNYLGIYKFKILKKLTKRKVLALGGISRINKKKVKLLDCYGFSGISYFEQKKGP